MRGGPGPGSHQNWDAPRSGTGPDEYMSTVAPLRPTTVWLYERELEHILRRFGSHQVNQLKPLEIQAWSADLLLAGGDGRAAGSR
jgi:Phage integrase, N-terminal SAM-like domain